MLGDILSHYYPDAQWSITSDNDYSTLEWFGPGDKPSEQDLSSLPWPVVAVPHSVTMRQARLALLQAGLLAQVDVAIDQLTEPDKTAARIEWEYSQEVQRDKPFVQMLAPALGLTEQDLDALFVQAATL